MVPKAALVRLTPEDRVVLEARVRAPTSEQRDVLRARIVLLADKPRPGPPAKYDAETGRRVLAVLDRPPPAGFAR